MGNQSSELQPNTTASIMMAPSQEDLEASWCQNCCGGCTMNNNVAFGQAFDVMVVVRRPSSSNHDNNSSSATVSTHAASRLYFSFPTNCKRDEQVFLEVWDGLEWIRFPIRQNGIQRQDCSDDDGYNNNDHDLVLSSGTNIDTRMINGRSSNMKQNGHSSPSTGSPSRNMKMDRWSDEPLSYHDDEQEMTKLLPRSSNNNSHNHHANDVHNEHDPLALYQFAKALKMGKNSARFVQVYNHAVIAMAPCFVHLWSTRDRIVVMDIDGSITKSNVLGLFDTLVTEAYSHVHDGVCQFLRQLIDETTATGTAAGGQLRILYLSSRPLVLANFTRKFLTQVVQPQHWTTSDMHNDNNTISLPDGPLMGYTGTIADILYMELITHSVHAFKHQALQENILAPWARLGEQILPFWAALGNTWMDVQAYQAAGIPLHRLGFITKQSIIHVLRPPLPALQSPRHVLFAPATPPVPDADHSFEGFWDPALLQYFRQEG